MRWAIKTGKAIVADLDWEAAAKQFLQTQGVSC
jgi:hypothetical protein